MKSAKSADTLLTWAFTVVLFRGFMHLSEKDRRPVLLAVLSSLFLLNDFLFIAAKSYGAWLLIDDGSWLPALGIVFPLGFVRKYSVPPYSGSRASEGPNGNIVWFLFPSKLQPARLVKSPPIFKNQTEELWIASFIFFMMQRIRATGLRIKSQFSFGLAGCFQNRIALIMTA